ncbi:MAG: hypothetical protein KGD57_00415 [Candidatus Lokiarchaeota archaeon]|nr:hypothetical protein [Candidatus Lokiarchaeota archaeon]
MAPRILHFLEKGVQKNSVGKHFITPNRKNGYSEHLIYDILQNVYHSTWKKIKILINREKLRQMIILTPEKIQTSNYISKKLAISPKTLRRNKHYLISFFIFKPTCKLYKINRKQFS